MVSASHLFRGRPHNLQVVNASDNWETCVLPFIYLSVMAARFLGAISSVIVIEGLLIVKCLDPFQGVQLPGVSIQVLSNVFKGWVCSAWLSMPPSTSLGPILSHRSQFFVPNLEKEIKGKNELMYVPGRDSPGQRCACLYITKSIGDHDFASANPFKDEFFTIQLDLIQSL